MHFAQVIILSKYFCKEYMELSAEQKQQLQEQKKHCPFCKIVSGEIPSQKVYEDDKILAILDINPFKPGHTLILPKEHYPIMPFLPEETFNHLFGLMPEFCKRLKEAMITKHCSVYVANGAAAGQQSGHFMIHLIPSDTPISQFSPPRVELDQKGYSELQRVLENNLPLMMRNRSDVFGSAPVDEQEQSKRLAELLEENPDFKQTLIDNPDAIRAGIAENPSLQELFAGVDIDALSERLGEEASQETPVDKQPENPEVSQEPVAKTVSQPEDSPPRAVDLSDSQLRSFVDSKPKLKDLLLSDMDALKQAIPTQERLQTFFSETTPEIVASRIKDKPTSLEDLAQ